MTGPQFLALYWSALGLAIAVGIALIVWVRSAPDRPPVNLDPYGVALLAGGWKRVGDTALAGLTARGQVHVSRSSGYTPVAGARPADGFEDAVLRELHGRGRSSFPEVGDSPAALDLQRRMAEAGLLRRPERARRGTRLGWVFLLIVVAGVARLVMGIANERPVGFLVASVIVAIVAWIVIVPSIASAGLRPTPTRQGRYALDRARRGVGVGAPYGGAAVAVGAAVLLPVAFAGLVAYPDPEVGQAFAANEAASASTGGGSSGDSGSSGDGGSGGGGGGGCGGCGGCG